MSKLLCRLIPVLAIAVLAIALTNRFQQTDKLPVSQASTQMPAQKADQTPPQAISATEIATTEPTDRIAHPPVRQTVTAGPYQLVITAEDHWQTPMTTSQLYEGETLRWQKDLPHQYGPRFSLVNSNGQVLLLDEYINVASPHALTLIDTTGDIVAQHSFDDIQNALNVSPADLTRQANSGWWISAPPTLSASGTSALIQTGGTLLEVDLATGALSRPTNL